MYENSLLIVLDTPNLKRIDGVDISKFEYKIKIDHHPFIEEFADIELIDETASSASQLVVELIKNTKLKLNKECAEKLYVGIVGDTNRFLYYYTTAKTFELVSYLFKERFLMILPIYVFKLFGRFGGIEFHILIYVSLKHSSASSLFCKIL